MKRCIPLLAAFAVLTACEQPTTTPTATQSAGDPAFARKSGNQVDPAYEQIAAFVERVNAGLEASGSEMRLEYPWLFRIGPGTDPFGRLRTGTRWSNPQVTYMLDESDYTTDVLSGDVDAVLVSAYDSWNNIDNTSLLANRLPDIGGNYDILDGVILDPGGNCIDIVDLAADNLIFYDPNTGLIAFIPAAHIVVGGWIDPAYFEDCLGSSSIIGVTWWFSVPDTDGDGYRDMLYVEQLYNADFAWTTTDAVYLDETAPIDIETIAVHENGHAVGLGHFGGPIHYDRPNGNQPFKLKPNLRVFNPEAVMNPFYLGGEERTPLPPDVAGLRSLYARGQ
jgi:hypothetical protein